MDFSSISQAFSTFSIDDALVWAVAATAGLVALVAVVNALDMFFDTEIG